MARPQNIWDVFAGVAGQIPVAMEEKRLRNMLAAKNQREELEADRAYQLDVARLNQAEDEARDRRRFQQGQLDYWQGQLSAKNPFEPITDPKKIIGAHLTNQLRDEAGDPINLSESALNDLFALEDIDRGTRQKISGGRAKEPTDYVSTLMSAAEKARGQYQDDLSSYESKIANPLLTGTFTAPTEPPSIWDLFGRSTSKMQREGLAPDSIAAELALASGSEMPTKYRGGAPSEEVPFSLRIGSDDLSAYSNEELEAMDEAAARQEYPEAFVPAVDTTGGGLLDKLMREREVDFVRDRMDKEMRRKRLGAMLGIR